MGKGRLEAFSDGVIAIIITIMVLELHPPTEPTLEALGSLTPIFLCYALSFTNVAIYWNNHHHLFQAVRVVDGRVLWANMLLLFCLSLFPFGTAWMGQHLTESIPIAVYGVILIAAALSYTALVTALVRIQPDRTLADAIGRDRKGLASLLCYAIAIPIAFFVPVAAFALFVAVALLWVVPDTRIERQLQH
jgi:TMEM175 potassium channel family protein